MQAILRDIGSWFWRLVPANPILVRVVSAGGRRIRHLWLRTGYLSILAAIAVIGVIAMQSREASLADLAKNATQVFRLVSIVQLALVCILAPVFTAAAITQEKDSQTYNILLSTPLTNGQIVLGSLFSRLYFVLMLLIAGIPLFCIMMVYGGVTGDKIAWAFFLSAGTAALTGSLAIAISVIKIGTGRTIFSFYLFIALYLIVVFSLASWNVLIPIESDPAPGEFLRMSWLAAFHPFLSLWVVLGMTPAPEFGVVAHYGFPWAQLAAYPQHSYLVITLLGSAFLIGVSLFFVRRGSKEGEDTFFSGMIGRFSARRRSLEERKPRFVWHNPVAWREAVTGASSGGGPLLRYTVFVGGLIVGFVLLVQYGNRSLTAAEIRVWLFAVVAVEVGVTLFIATTTAATSMTREKESNTLELLLCTPLTSHAIIRGKIRGLVTSAGPLLMLPYITIVLFIAIDVLTGRLSAAGGPAVYLEALLTMPILLIAFTSFACMLGLQASIKYKKTLTAVFASMAIVLGIFAVLAGCAFAVQESSAEIAAACMPLNPVTAPFVILDPAVAVGGFGSPATGPQLEGCRIIASVASIAAALIYGLVGYGMHRSMVRNFDMIIRKQSA